VGRDRLLNIHILLPLRNIQMQVLHALNKKRFPEQAESDKQLNRFDEHVAGAEGGY
jgi:hypothetical protein